MEGSVSSGAIGVRLVGKSKEGNGLGCKTKIVRGSVTGGETKYLIVGR